MEATQAQAHLRAMVRTALKNANVKARTQAAPSGIRVFNDQPWLAEKALMDAGLHAVYIDGGSNNEPYVYVAVA